MKRRTVIRRIGASGIATTAFAGSASAAHAPGSRTGSVDYGIDREIDVADVSGAVTLDELLEPEEVQGLPAEIDPRTHEITVADDAGTIQLQECCKLCSKYPYVCDCDCCDLHCKYCPDGC